MKNMNSDRRETLLRTATDLFYRHGCHTTGIDKVLAESGVAKMTLYKHFGSKDKLVLAAAQRFHEQGRFRFETAVKRKGIADPAERLMAIFDQLEEWVRSDEFHGCPSVNLAVQYPDQDDPVHEAAANHKRRRGEYFAGLARDAGAEEPNELAAQIALLMDGATVLAQVTGDVGFVRKARATARLLLDQALSRSDSNDQEELRQQATGG